VHHRAAVTTGDSPRTGDRLSCNHTCWLDPPRNRVGPARDVRQAYL